MELDIGVAALVLVAGALHAIWNALVKTGEDRTAVLILVMAAGALPWLPLIFVLPAPDPASWPYLLASVVIHLGYSFGLLGAYRHGDFSRVYPIARGSAPLLVAGGAWAIAGEQLRPLEWLGVTIVSAGIVSLAWQRGFGAKDLKASGFALVTGCSIASYVVVDGLGVRASGAPLSYIAWLFGAEGVTMAAIGILLRQRELVSTVRGNWARGLMGGVLSTLSYGIAIWAMNAGAMAHVAALRETSVLIAAVIGTCLLGDPFGRRRFVAAALVALGAVLVQGG